MRRLASLVPSGGNLESKRFRRPGAAAAELAVLLPFLCFVFVVAIDYCRLFYFAQILRNCAHVAALNAAGATYHPGNDREEAARQAAVLEGASLSPALKKEDVSVTYETDFVRVTVTYRFSTVSGYLGMAGVREIKQTVTHRLVPKVGG